jgi:hypothetical protein
MNEETDHREGDAEVVPLAAWLIRSYKCSGAGIPRIVRPFFKIPAYPLTS